MVCERAKPHRHQVQAGPKGEGGGGAGLRFGYLIVGPATVNGQRVSQGGEGGVQGCNCQLAASKLSIRCSLNFSQPSKPCLQQFNLTQLAVPSLPPLPAHTPASPLRSQTQSQRERARARETLRFNSQMGQVLMAQLICALLWRHFGNTLSAVIGYRLSITAAQQPNVASIGLSRRG